MKIQLRDLFRFTRLVLADSFENRVKGRAVLDLLYLVQLRGIDGPVGIGRREVESSEGVRRQHDGVGEVGETFDC